MPHNILIVEDEIKLANLLKDYFLQENMQCDIEVDGNKVMERVRANKPDIILLDIMLPNKDGISLCKEIRQDDVVSSMPIVMTTARVEEIDRLLGLEMGADDYVCKPYSPREVVARVKAILRRTQQNHSSETTLLSLNDDKLLVTIEGDECHFTAVEYAIIRLLSNNPGKIYSRQQIMDNMYNDYRVVSERTIDSHVKKIRQKFSRIKPDMNFIHSVYGVGYKLEI